MSATIGVAVGLVIAALEVPPVDAPPPDAELTVSPVALGDEVGQPELVLRHAPDSRMDLAPIFVLYSSGVVLVDNEHWGDPSGYRVGRPDAGEWDQLRRDLAVPVAFFGLPRHMQAGRIRDGALYEIIARADDGRYKAAAVRGLIHSDGPLPEFVEELKIGRAQTPKAFLRLLDRILSIRLVGGALFRPPRFKIRAIEAVSESQGNCSWPHSWPRPTERDRAFDPFSSRYYILEMDGAMWSDYLKIRERRCRNGPVALGSRRFFVEATVPLPGQEDWEKR